MDVITGSLCGGRRHEEFLVGADASKELVRQWGDAVICVPRQGERDLLPSHLHADSMAKQTLRGRTACKISNDMLAVTSKGFAPNS